MKKFTLIAGAALAAATFATPAAADIGFRLSIGGANGGVTITNQAAPAQYRPGRTVQRHMHRLPPQAVARHLQRQGYQGVQRLSYQPRRNVYTADARYRGGARVQLVVDARSGAVLNRTFVRRF